MCNYSANSLLDIISFLFVSLEVFYQIIYKPLKQDHVDFDNILDFFAILNALSRNTLLAAVLLFKSSESPWDILCWKQTLLYSIQ